MRREPRDAFDHEIEVEVVGAGALDRRQREPRDEPFAGIDVAVVRRAMPIEVDHLAERLSGFVEMDAQPRPSGARCAGSPTQPPRVPGVRHAQDDLERLSSGQRHRSGGRRIRSRDASRPGRAVVASELPLYNSR